VSYSATAWIPYWGMTPFGWWIVLHAPWENR
jgi:hypothetical protein